MQIYNQSLFFRRSLVEKYGNLDKSFRFAFDYKFITRYTSYQSTRVLRVDGLAEALRFHADAKLSLIADIGKEESKRVKNQYNSTLKYHLRPKLGYLCSRFKKMYYLASDLVLAYFEYRMKR
jgi:hypothetical protein